MATGTTFEFRAVDSAGAPARGELEAESKGQVAELLRARGLIVLDVDEKGESFKIEDLFKRWRKVGKRDMAVFARQFATLTASGMPMLRTLQTLEDQCEDDLLSEAISGVRQDVEAGSAVAQAMERRPDIFDRLFVSMIRSGEQSGRLDDALERIAFHMEKSDALRRQVRSALMYPSFVFAMAMVVMIIVVTFIVPVFTGIFEDIAADQPGTSSDLPLMTQITVGISDAITGYWYLVIAATVGLVIGFRRWKATESGRRQWDRIKLGFPAHIGDVIHKVALARWSRTFAGVVASGVPLLQSIRITGETSGNALIEDSMEEVIDSVQGGGSLAGPIERNSDIYPPMVGHMVSVGEETGQLEDMLEKIADFYEDEVDAKVKALTSLIEPIMIALIGCMVGFIVISMYLPIFELYDKIR